MLHFRNWSDPYLVKPNDFKPDMKDIFFSIGEFRDRKRAQEKNSIFH